PAGSPFRRKETFEFLLKRDVSSFRRRPESSDLKMFYGDSTPVFAGVTHWVDIKVRFSKLS
ncbi:MAG: hypothetical protein PHN75_20270, partial [Syntrophales bacterium]|nr:hypothetical protein [Syntrophales bacterium]